MTSEPCDDIQNGVNNVNISAGPTYDEYLKLDRLLSCQRLLSDTDDHDIVPDEHLFIIIHQAYELWFKQILFDLEIVIQIFNTPIVDEAKQFKIVSLLDRIVKILKLLVDQILILETMPPLEFVEFRRYLSPASGFQSFQFRMIENKLGLKLENRVPYNCAHYKEAFRNEHTKNELVQAENGVTLFNLLQKWLERTPGLEKDGFNFWDKYKFAVRQFLEDQKEQATELSSSDQRAFVNAELEKLETSFGTILDTEIYRALMERGDRRLSHKALQGALMLSFYRDIPRFSQPNQILILLMDIDSLITKWRYNHVMLVQRMLGSKQGTGGSSGYMYLRSTISDRYKIFVDLFNLSTWLIPKKYIPHMPLDIYRDLSRAVLIEKDSNEQLSNKIRHAR